MPPNQARTDEVPLPVTRLLRFGAACALCALAAPALVAPGVATPALAAHPKAQQGQKQDPMMLHLSPATRMEQRCNARAMGEIQRGSKGMRPDELVAYAFADTKVGTDTIAAPGAAVRSAGHWYHLSYQCQTSADGMDIRSLSYVLGREVPRGDWAAHYLVP